LSRRQASNPSHAGHLHVQQNQIRPQRRRQHQPGCQHRGPSGSSPASYGQEACTPSGWIDSEIVQLTVFVDALSLQVLIYRTRAPNPLAIGGSAPKARGSYSPSTRSHSGHSPKCAIRFKITSVVRNITFSTGKWRFFMHLEESHEIIDRPSQLPDVWQERIELISGCVALSIAIRTFQLMQYPGPTVSRYSTFTDHGRGVYALLAKCVTRISSLSPNTSAARAIAS